MSLNCKEIDLILSELDIENSKIQKIIQPTYDTIILYLYNHQKVFNLLICVANGFCRLHETHQSIPKSVKPIRFCELLKKYILNTHIVSVKQLGEERIIRFDLSGNESNYILYARLWSGASNVILTQSDGSVIDALSRKPDKDELTGGYYHPEENVQITDTIREYKIREFTNAPNISFNEYIDSLYAQKGGIITRENLIAKLNLFFDHKKLLINRRIQELEKTVKKYSVYEQFREFGDILMANTHTKIQGETLEVFDFFNNKTIGITVNAELSIIENAKQYYTRHKKAKSGMAEVCNEIELLKERLALLNTEQFEMQSNPYATLLNRKLYKFESEKNQKRKQPGLILNNRGWQIRIGRNAKENDALLRKYSRGNDIWLHARDCSGGYVFIKARSEKTVPLEVLIDAGMLALYYSKNRHNPCGDLYYTNVKYLRRIKNATLGMVVPTNEKNLHIQMDLKRLRVLKSMFTETLSD